MKRVSILVAWLAASSSPALALSSLERIILEELSCQSPPSPTGIVHELISEGLIKPNENIGYDSLSCWRIVGDLSIEGVSFVSICAFEEDEFIRSMNEDIYYRAPGTSPGQTLAFGTTLDGDKLSDWYFGLFGPAHVHSAISEGDMTHLGDPSEVSCTGWMF